MPGAENVHLGLIIYHKDAEIHITFGQQYDVTQLRNLVQDIPFINTGGGENRLDKALYAAANDLFTLRSGVRQGTYLNSPFICLT